MNAQIVRSKEAELVQTENRVEQLKAEFSALQKQNAKLDEEIVAKKTDYQTFIQLQEQQSRANNERLVEDQRLLENQRAEFKALLEKHNSEKEALVREKTQFLREKSRCDGQMRAINDFITAVRRAYNVLPTE